MYYVYIIKSAKDGSFYIGSTYHPEDRILWHNDPERNTGKSRSKMPWEYFLIMEVPNNRVGLRLEKHIKRMKSRKYIQNLKDYQDLRTKLINRFTDE
ncbi:GIY-YIG nuclease family protein [Robiginitalea aestuariiviva]|uniref:GIY-YIG nuclease family protein n=1 Tax=Robiginitalea aestuariiviva TaxID=3036903 RepID=UPI003B983F34